MNQIADDDPDVEIILQRRTIQDPLLSPHLFKLKDRMRRLIKIRRALCNFSNGAYDATSAYLHYGLHFSEGQWVFREWAPNATAVFLICDRTGWRKTPESELHRIKETGDWEIRLPGNFLEHGCLYRLHLEWNGGSGNRIPAYATRVVQDPMTLIFNAQVWRPEQSYDWKHSPIYTESSGILVYEAHVGMAQDAEKIGTYAEFTEKILPRIAQAGYDTIQLMALQEHPYYASFGYQVSSFFAPSSRFGTPDELKALIDTAHGMGLRVLMDLIHSHAVLNEVEGLSRFDGTLDQYFHPDFRGYHPAWNSRCFDYGKIPVLSFLLSNCRYWMEEFRLDGFRFDGVTSMLYYHRGLEMSFSSYSQYFDDSVDPDAMVYLTLANELIHEIHSNAVTVAEDVSGMPGLCLPGSVGGSGFDYRFAMGIADYWIRLVKDTPDEFWPMGHLWYELNNRRQDEKTISYAESHDQALVGDQTLIFRMIGTDMYDGMSVCSSVIRVDRGIALHKMIRLITLATAGDGYLNFMGNEFGHPEWIDFPREGNGWSFFHARRQWHLRDNPFLRYTCLAEFDREMIALAKRERLYNSSSCRLLLEDDGQKLLAFERNDLVFVFNFHPCDSYTDHLVPVFPGKYQMIMDSDMERFGGHGRLTPEQFHFSRMDSDLQHRVSLYIPSRVAFVLKPTS
jgi:1,4-alpha-glucan branching enzyme